MLFNTPTEWVALGVTLLAGWLLGLASSSGGKKWKQRLQEEEESSAAWREEAERAQRRISELEKARDAAPSVTTASEPVAAGAGAVAATALNRDSKDAPEPAPQSDETKNWIPEGPPPPPLAMGTPEPAPQPQPQPIAPDAPAYPTAPAPVQEEVKAAQPDSSFHQPVEAAPPPATPAIAAPAPEAAPVAPAAAEPRPAPPIAQSEARPVQRSHEWLPPHVRAD